MIPGDNILVHKDWSTFLLPNNALVPPTNEKNVSSSESWSYLLLWSWKERKCGVSYEQLTPHLCSFQDHSTRWNQDSLVDRFFSLSISTSLGRLRRYWRTLHIPGRPWWYLISFNSSIVSSSIMLVILGHYHSGALLASVNIINIVSNHFLAI